MLDFVAPDHKDAASRAIQEGIKNGTATVETDLVTKDGRKISFYTSGSLIKMNDVLHIIGTSIDVSREREVKEELARNYDVQKVINTLLGLSLEEVPLKEILKHALDIILSIPWLSFESRGSMFTVEDGSDTLVMQAQSGLAEPLLDACAKVPYGHCLCGKAAKSKKIIYADRLDHRHETTYANIAPHGHYCVPIMSSERVLGVINIYIRGGHARNEVEVEFLKAVANTLAGIIVRKEEDQIIMRTTARLEKTVEGTVQAIATVVETRDPYTAGHQNGVAKVAVAVAKELGLSEDEIEGIRTAATIHDIGKINVPAEILSKPGRLTGMEFEIIKTHPEAGHNILKKVEFPWPIGDMVLQHHERLDGSGYPHGLREKNIVLGAKILAVADVMEAMSTHRPYRPALGVNIALAEIEKNKGRLYDAEAVDACLKVFKRGFTFHE